MIEKHSCYEFAVFKYPDDEHPSAKHYYYKIFGEACPPYDDGIIESDEWFDAEQEARFAAIGHISLLENGGM